MLGSDVPYCLLGGTALCYGRGEIIERMSENLKLHLVVTVADEHVSTPFAYSELDRIYSDFKGPRSDDSGACFDAISESVATGKLSDSNLYNVFENAILPICSGAESIKSKLYELGATHALMSGSGPSVFGVFKDKANAESARDALINYGVKAYYAETV